MEPRITLITLGVSNLDRSIRFYRDGLGLPKREGPEGIAFFETRGTWLSLYPAIPWPRTRPFPQTDLGFAVSRWRTTWLPRKRSTELSSRPSMPVRLSSSRGRRCSGEGTRGYFADPDGFLWEVAWNPHFTVE